MLAKSPFRARLALALPIAAAAALLIPAAASAHARVSPAVSVAGQLQLYSLAVPTEKENADDREGRDDRPGRVRDRLVRAAATGVDAARAPDRVGRQRGRHRGDVDGRQDADRRGLAVSVPRAARIGQDLHVPGTADVFRRVDRELVGVGVLRRARADDRSQGLARRRELDLGADDRRAGRRSTRAARGRLRARQRWSRWPGRPLA